MTQEGTTTKLDKRRRILAVVKLIALAVILVGVPLYIYFFQHDLIERFSDIKELENTLRSYRKESMLIYVGCQILQVVLSVIPGQALQFAGGYLYGALLGLILSIIGIGIGSTLAYYIARLLGRDAIHLFFGKRKVTEMLDLMNSPKGLIVTFVIFLIPGIPKDLCSYAAGISNLKLRPYLIVSMIARIPGMLGCLIIGQQVGAGGYTSAAIIAAVALVLLIFGVIFRKKILDTAYNLTDKLLQL